MATTSELVDECLAHQFNANRYTALFVGWLDEAQKRLVRQSKIRTQQMTYAFPTTVSVASYALPNDFARIISLRDTDVNARLTPISLNHYDDLGDSIGKPSAYTDYASNLSLYPIPDASTYNLELRYFKLPETLSITGDVVDPEIEESYDDLLVHYALHRAYLAEHDYPAAAQHEERWERGLAKLRADLEWDTREGPKQVRGTWATYSNY